MENDTFMWFPDDAGTLGDSQPVGETTDEWFSQVGAFELRSFNVHVELGDAPEGGSEKYGVAFRPMEIVKSVDLASVLLLRACTEHTPLPTAILVLRLAGGEPLMYLQYVFRNLFVNQVKWGQQMEGGRAEETVVLTYEEMGIQYIQQLPDGTPQISGTWVYNTAGNETLGTDSYFVGPYQTAEDWKSSH